MDQKDVKCEESGSIFGDGEDSIFSMIRVHEDKNSLIMFFLGAPYPELEIVEDRKND